MAERLRVVTGSNPTELVKNSYIEWAMKAYEEQQKVYEMYDAYYYGEHPLGFSTDKWKQAFGTTFEDFSDNWCQVVVDALGQRLEIIGWESEDNAAQKLAEEIWDDEMVDQEEDDLHLQTLIKGDGYLMVWENPEEADRVDMVFHDALDINVFYDPSDKRRISRASKLWVEEDGLIRLNIYTPQEIRRYSIQRDQNELTPAELASARIPTDELLPKGWTQFDKPIIHKYGRVPIFHFKNRSAGSTHGNSELATVIPIQQMVNKVLMDMALGSEFAGFPQKWMAGGGHPKDGWKAGPERVWSTTDSQAKFGQFDSMEFDGPRGFVELLVGHVAKTTQTPMHFLRTSGDMPSGEALKVAESGLVQKGKNRHKRWKHPWGHAMSFAVYMKTGTPPKKPLHPVFKSPETRHDLEQAQTAQLKSILGVPLQQLWMEHFGYTSDQVDEFLKLNKQIAAAALAQILTQSGQVAPGASGSLADLLEVEPGTTLEGLDIPQVLAMLSKGKTSQTTAGEATTKPQANTSPPASPTRRSSGFKD